MPVVDAGFVSVTVILCVFAAYISFQVRRALPNPTYRSRALWTGMVSLAIVPYGILIIAGDTNIIGPTTNPYSPSFVGISNLALYATYITLTIVDSLLLFFWIDSTIRVAYDLDFFHRDTLHWKSLRRYSWAIVVVGAVGGGFAFNQFLYIVFGLVLAAPITFGAAVLIQSVPRIYDDTMRRHVRWMGLLFLTVIVEIVTNSFSFYLNFPLVVFAYCLYRAAGALSMRSHVEADVPQGSGGFPSPRGRQMEDDTKTR